MPCAWVWTWGLLTSANTFVASANCAFYCGANVDFVDIDPRTYNMSVEALAVKLQKAENGQLPKIVIPVHFGWSTVRYSHVCSAKNIILKLLRMLHTQLALVILISRLGCGAHSEITVFSFQFL